MKKHWNAQKYLKMTLKMHFLKIKVRRSWFYEKWLGSMLSVDLVTWIESVRACQVPSMFAQSFLSPSVVSDNVVFDGTFVVQPRQKLGGLPVATVRFPFPVGPQHIRPVRFYLLTVMLTVFKYERFFKVNILYILVHMQAMVP